LEGARVLCLASAGGQQAPILAAAGAEVVSFDLSENQLALDRMVAERDGLAIRCVQGDMADLSVLSDQEFDLVFNPISTVFVSKVIPVWKECFRVTRPGGTLLSGFMNPSFFLFDHDLLPQGEPPLVRYRLPYSESDPEQLSAARRQALESGEAMEFSHSLDDLIGGQLAAGFVITGFYEDWWDAESTPLNAFSPTSMATRASRSS
jgi:ubiquinone/menaquinone biosynthesis C-methylase UbiE